MDYINSLFQILCSFFLFNNCYSLYKDKQVKGISLQSTLFFSIYSWFLFFYWLNLSQIWSFYTSLFTALANSIWFIMMIYYSKKNNIKSKTGIIKTIKYVWYDPFIMEWKYKIKKVYKYEKSK